VNSTTRSSIVGMGVPAGLLISVLSLTVGDGGGPVSIHMMTISW
jgi:hypothetical protein